MNEVDVNASGFGPCQSAGYGFGSCLKNLSGKRDSAFVSAPSPLKFLNKLSGAQMSRAHSNSLTQKQCAQPRSINVMAEPA